MESVAINKGNNKKSFFTCFKPDMAVVDNDDDSFKPTRKRQKGNATPDPVLAYLSAADKNGVVVTSSAVEEVEGEDCGNRRRKKGRGAWHSFRKALNDTSMIKKIVKRWRTRKESISRSNSHSTGTKINHKQKIPPRTNSNASSTLGANSSTIFTSSSSLSSTSSSSRIDHMSGSSSNENSPPLNRTSRQNSVEERRKRKCDSNKALCMLSIISLLVLILWGKFFAILCTSIWFYLLPRTRRRQLWKEEVACVEESNEFDSVQYKKKVIIEGMLERKHSRVSLASMSKS